MEVVFLIFRFVLVSEGIWSVVVEGVRVILVWLVFVYVCKIVIKFRDNEIFFGVYSLYNNLSYLFNVVG